MTYVNGLLNSDPNRVADAGIDTSAGNVGNSCDNALTESIIGLFQAAVISLLGRWKSMGQVEWETEEECQALCVSAAGPVPF